MKNFSFLAFLVVAGAIFYFSGGVELLGLSGNPSNLPETTQPPNATFMGYEQSNPYAKAPPTPDS